MSDRRSFLGTGVGFPLIVAADGSLTWSSGEQSIAESILTVLATAPGERVMRPDFGCRAHELVFASNDPATHASIAHHAREALVNGEPRIEVLDVRVEGRGELDNVLLIEIDYQILANNSVHNLVYPYYIREGER